MKKNNRQQQKEAKSRELKTMARRIFLALTNKKFNAGKKEVLDNLLAHFVSESSITADHEQLIEIAFPLMMEAVERERGIAYGHGIFSALQAILEGEPDADESKPEVERVAYKMPNDLNIIGGRLLAEAMVDLMQ